VTVWTRSDPHQKPPVRSAEASDQGPIPFALVERNGRGLCLRAVNGAAQQLGLWRGQSQADARAMAPELVTVPADPAAEALALQRLALWAERFSPCVALMADGLGPEGAGMEGAGMEGLALDMTGAAHLFGGELAFISAFEARLAKAGILARVAMADSLGAAWALARFGGMIQIAPAGGAREALTDLPVEALRLDPEAVTLLKRFGLQRIGDLYPLPRAGLARRFRGPRAGAMGLKVVERLDQALGFRAEPVMPVRPPPAYRSFQVFAEPITETAGVALYLPDLAKALVEQLQRDGQGARRLTLTGYRVDGATTSIEAGLSAASVQPSHLLRLLKEKGLEALDLGFGIDALMLSAPVAEPSVAQQGGLDGERAATAATALAGLIDRLQAKLGEHAVQIPRPRGSWLPERSEGWDAASSLGFGAFDPVLRPRPILLFHPPERVEAIAELPDSAPARFTWRRVARRVVRAEGPERIAPEWWRLSPASPRPPRTRDYYRIEDETGRRYWLFREGLYGREDQDRTPQWWLHGVFA
jgi:protein ImuB